MNRRKLQQEQKVEQTSHVEQHRETETLTTAEEEVLRADARQTTVPPTIAARLKDTIAREPRPRKGILGRFFSR